MQKLEEIRQAAEPTLESLHGQLVILSTSNGPTGYFPNICRIGLDAAAQGVIPQRRTLKFLFFPWTARPSRDQAWYETEKAKHPGDPLYMKREYPATPEEAFEAAMGRVYPLFSAYGEIGKLFVRTLKLEPGWPRYRGIDFGGTDPFACLWAATVPGDPPGFTIDPSCTNTIRELLSYVYDDKGRIVDAQNHTCDAARYLTVTPGADGLKGQHVHIYRELYESNSVARGLTLIDLAKRIVALSEGEKFRETIADRSRPDSILELGRQGIPCRGQRHFPGDEIAQGVERVNELIVATAKQSPDSARGKRSLTTTGSPVTSFV